MSMRFIMTKIDKGKANEVPDIVGSVGGGGH
jgi:hypothetical protein